jgi:PncC family amidohydrolase
MINAAEAIYDKASELVAISRFEGLTFGFAESLTGGLISASVVNIPGASASFKGSVVSYTNEVKENVLGVPRELIDTYTEVSDECAKAMAEGALNVLGVDIAVSVTGIAGPTGELPGKPVGTVYMGYCCVKGNISGTLRLNFKGDRDTIRTCTVLAALNQAVALIKDGKV